MDNSVKILGCRGSIPVSGEEFVRFGGATTCFLLRLGGQNIIVDAGSGLMHLPQERKAYSLLLSHPHLDHLLGIPMCPLFFRPDTRIEIYADHPEAIEKMVSPPLWPITPKEFTAQVGFHGIPDVFQIGAVAVETYPGNHPGGVRHFRITAQGVSVVIMTDCTVDAQDEALVRFAQGCDLLLIDGQYSPEEWPHCSTFGHNTWHMAAQFAENCHAKDVRIIHHAPNRTDRELLDIEAALSQQYPLCRFGREEELIRL